MKKETILDNEKKVVILDYEDCDLVVLYKHTGKRMWYVNPTLSDLEKIISDEN